MSFKINYFICNYENLFFRKYKVDIIMVGHMHKYERTCGMIDDFVCGERDEDGIVWI